MYFYFYRFPIYQQAKIDLFIFDITLSKQDFANIHQNAIDSLGIVKLIV